MTYEAEHPQADLEQLDRLVDGELSETERRRVLSGLDAAPDGWRRCALAFLEAQTWRQACRDPLAKRPVAEPAAAGLTTGISDGWSRAWRWATPLALAASFLIGIGLSLVWRPGGAGDGLRPATTHQVVQQKLEPHEATVVARAPRPGTPQEAVAAGEGPAARVRLVWAGDGGDSPADPEAGVQEVELPVIDSQELERSWQDMAQGLSGDLLRRLGQLGHRVRVERQMVPVQMDDGRPAAVPVDRVNVIFVGNDYQ